MRGTWTRTDDAKPHSDFNDAAVRRREAPGRVSHLSAFRLAMDGWYFEQPYSFVT